LCLSGSQRAALEARKYRKSHPKAVDSFLEELVVRRELSDNYCYYQPNYDNVSNACERSLPGFLRFRLLSFSM
jgi:deoxyribodipyrimidine photo-lyase